ncbi:MAG: fimbrial protein [Lysobacteraceae bacterium]|nr:MAG: fimbrial protein [Xanthomonadaceae bacterium]
MRKYSSGPSKAFAATAIGIASLLSPLWVHAQAVLEDVSFNTGAGGNVEVLLTLDSAAPEPRVFTTESPPRIALDLNDTRSALAERTLAVGQGATRSVTAVEAAGRTRVVIDLFRNVPYEIRRTGNTLVIDIAGGVAAAVASAEAAERMGGSSVHLQRGSVSKIDFRRGKDGEGRVIVHLQGEPSGSDLSQQGDKIRVELFDTRVPAELERRIDVMDFATPVDMIDSFNEGGRAVMLISANGNFEHMAYQADNQFVIEVSLIEEEEEVDARSLLEDPVYEGERVTFTFQDIAVRAVLQLIADVSQLNIVVSDAVGGNVTLRLNNVPWDQALDLILQSKQLDKRQNGNVIWVAPANEIAAYEQQRLQALVQKEELEPIRSDFIQVNYAKASDLAALLSAGGGGERTGLLSDRGAVSVDERTNTLLISDTPTKLGEVRELIGLLDRPVRQVQIESRIVIANSDFSRDIGVRFGVTGTNEDSNGNIYSTGGSLEALDRMNNLSLINRLNGLPSGLPNVGPSIPPGGIAAPPLTERLNVNLPVANAAGTFGWTLLASDYLLDLEISALEAEGRGEVISSPRMIAANQVEAYIQQGVEIPYQQATSSGATAIQFKDAVLELRARPLITPDNRIQLDLTVKQDTVGDEVPTGTGGTVPTIDTREIETKVLVDNGQTVVLGGIYEQNLRDQTNKVPFFGDLPMVGSLFRQRLRQFDKAELLIFITPTILQENY